jgi:hypothetical protein
MVSDSCTPSSCGLVPKATQRWQRKEKGSYADMTASLLPPNIPPCVCAYIISQINFVSTLDRHESIRAATSLVIALACVQDFLCTVSPLARDNRGRKFGPGP